MVGMGYQIAGGIVADGCVLLGTAWCRDYANRRATGETCHVELGRRH